MNAQCSGCGVPVPDGQNNLCSTCYGDPDWGSDGYLRAALNRNAEAAAELDRQAAARAEDERRSTKYEPAL